MNKQKYEQKKHECWEEYLNTETPQLAAWNKRHAKEAFDSAFDRAYALGEQAEIISLEEDGRAAEGEDEILTVSRKDIQYYYQYHKAKSEARLSAEHKAYYKGRTEELLALFGPKCLPDETKDETKEPKPAEPKYHVGDWVRVVSTDKHGHIGQITEVEYEYGCNYYQVSGTEGWHFLEKNLEPYTKPAKSKAEPKLKVGDIVHFKYGAALYRIDGYKILDGVMLYQVGEVWAEESELEPYTEPNTSHETPVCENHSDNTSQKEVNVNSNRNLSQETANCDKEFDNILKNSLSYERRLNVAAMAMQGILSNSLLMEMFPVTNQDKVVHCALVYADALISECESSAQPLCHAKKGGQE